MRLKNNLLFKEQFEMIEKECSQIIDAYKATNEYLYRGTEKVYAPFEKIIPRSDRKPLSTEKTLHKKFDDEFFSMYGWRARSEGLFVTGEQSDAYSYGEHTYIVFPRNGFKFLWSKEIDDLWMDIGVSFYEPSINIIKHYTKEQLEDFKRTADTQIQKALLSYKSTDLKGAIESGHEVMIKCDYYYAFDYDKISDIDEILHRRS